MQHLNNYFSPVEIESEKFKFLNNSEDLLFSISKHTKNSSEIFKDIDKFDIAIMGIPEDRNSTNKGCSFAPSKIRKALYKLYKPAANTRIIDLGDIKKGKTVKDSYAAVKDIVSELLSLNVVPVIIGGSNDLCHPVFLAYKKITKALNIVSIDSRFDLGNTEDNFDSDSYLSKIILEKKSNLFNYTNIGYQTYYVSRKDISLMNELYFDTIRLGTARSNIAENEPYIRDADFVSVDLSSVKQADAPGHSTPSVNGFYGEEICQLARYAGLSDRLSSFGIFEANPNFDINNQTIELSAQILWHFIQGYYLRKKDYPKINIKTYKKYIVSVEGPEHKITFYKSMKTNRMWMEVPYLDNDKEEIIIISCSYNDYQKAIKNEIPDKWWKFYQKLN